MNIVDIALARLVALPQPPANAPVRADDVDPGVVGLAYAAALETAAAVGQRSLDEFLR